MLSYARVVRPPDIKGTNVLTWRYPDERPDCTYVYVPAIRRLRRMSSGNRSDSYLGSDMCVDDNWGYAGKVSAFEWKVVKKGEQLVPFCEGEPVRIFVNDDGEWETAQHDRMIALGCDAGGYQGAPWFWDYPVFIVGINDRAITGEVLPLPDPVLDLLAELTGSDPRSTGLNGVPLNPRNGKVPRKNILRWVIGLDKQLWIRPLNANSMFFLSMQYFGQWFPDYESRLIRPVPEPGKSGVSSTGTVYPDFRVYPKIKETETMFTGALNTVYLAGALAPQLALVYDVRGAWLIQPSVKYVREPFRFALQYSAIAGNFVNLGIMRDRDQISFSISYLLD